jgi:hypothetical protein
MSAIKRQDKSIVPIKIENRSFEDVAKFDYLATILTGSSNCMHEELTSTLN